MSVFSQFNWVNALEILFIIAVVLIFYKKYIRHTQSEKLVRGIMFLFVAWIFSEILGVLKLTILGMFLKSMVALISLSLIVIFQPELRRFLSYLGQPGFLSKTFFGITNHQSGNEDDEIDVIKELVESVKYLTKTKTGALIVLQNELSPSAYSEVGTKLNADVSAELILTVFHPNTPLHDGAMVIKDKKILSAGVLLPLTENPKLSWKYGTRHRAAIGLTEITDSACLVVSEETGDVSICMDGTLKKYDDLVTLKEDLEKILNINDTIDEKKNGFFSSFIKK
ncbi:MAG: diadenylate cyclase CdaA [Cyanobacteria bacterium RUI128]|nr:diadenylate cyclase CdaA [Cyanobacteria bacterium RUI128]